MADCLSETFRYVLVLLSWFWLAQRWHVAILLSSPLSARSEDLLKMALGLREFLVVALSLFISTLNGQLPKKEKYYAIKEDIPHIRCETCQKAVRYLYGKTQAMRAEGVTKRVSHHRVYCCLKCLAWFVRNLFSFLSGYAGGFISPVGYTVWVKKTSYIC